MTSQLSIRVVLCTIMVGALAQLSGCAGSQCATAQEPQSQAAPEATPQTPPLAYSKRLTGMDDIQQAVDKVTVALKSQGFGVISDMDMAAAMKKKLDADMAPYRILGACNPKLAFAALQKDKNIGLLLPCKVTIYQDGDDYVVSFANPEALFSLMGDPELVTLAVEVDKLFKAAFDAI